MSIFLKQSTAVTIKLGPFVSSTDGFTAQTALTLSQADFRLSKNGGDMAQKNETSSATHDEIGYYDVALDTTDTNTLGRLRVMVSESGALPVWADFMVVPANVWDSLFGADRLQVDMRELGDSNLALTTQMKADVNAEADTALADYDAPTKAELDSAVATLATAANLATLAGYVDTEVATLVTNVAAILADTGTDGVVLSTAVQNAIADAVLTRSVTNTEASAGIYSLTAIILAAFESAISGATWTIKQSDGTTTFATRTVTTDDTAEPIVSVT